MNNWQNDEDFLKEYPERDDDGKVIFAYVGSINGHANVDLMIRAFVAARMENAELRIYGGGNKKEFCVNLAKELGAKNIVFDMVSREKVAFVQSQADVLVLALPTGNGNLCLPSKLTSYMLSGKAVLASVDKGSSTQKIIEKMLSGVTVVPDDEKALADSFKLMAERGKGELQAMGERSRKYAKKELTRDVNLGKVVDTINSILG